MISEAVKLAPAEFFTKATMISSSTFSRESLRTSATTGELELAVCPNTTPGRHNTPITARTRQDLMTSRYAYDAGLARRLAPTGDWPTGDWPATVVHRPKVVTCYPPQVAPVRSAHAPKFYPPRLSDHVQDGPLSSFRPVYCLPLGCDWRSRLSEFAGEFMPKTTPTRALPPNRLGFLLPKAAKDQGRVR